MNLDNLKELEAKATPGEWYDSEHLRDDTCMITAPLRPDEKHDKYAVATCVLDDIRCEDAEFIAEFRNQAKEMISTIERYKRALEIIKSGWTDDDAKISEPIHDSVMMVIANEALKDPETTKGEQNDRP